MSKTKNEKVTTEKVMTKYDRKMERRRLEQEKEAKALGATPPPRLQFPGRSAGPRRSLLFKAKPSLGGRRKNPPLLCNLG